MVYCTHEYTLSNLKFALTQIDDLDIKEEVKSLNEILANGGISLPSTILKRVIAINIVQYINSIWSLKVKMVWHSDA